MAEFDGRRVPVWDFNDIDVSAARDPSAKLYFSVRVMGVACRANIWVHGTDARTLMPQPFQAEAELPVTAANAPAEVDARIQILWPHGGASISQALLANLSADLFAHGTRTRLSPAKSGPTWQPAIWLVRAGNNGVGERVALRRPAHRCEWHRPLGLQRCQCQHRPPTHQQTAFLDRGRWGADLFQLLDARARRPHILAES